MIAGSVTMGADDRVVRLMWPSLRWNLSGTLKGAKS